MKKIVIFIFLVLSLANYCKEEGTFVELGFEIGFGSPAIGFESPEMALGTSLKIGTENKEGKREFGFLQINGIHGFAGFFGGYGRRILTSDHGYESFGIGAGFIGTVDVIPFPIPMGYYELGYNANKYLDSGLRLTYVPPLALSGTLEQNFTTPKF